MTLNSLETTQSCVSLQGRTTRHLSLAPLSQDVQRGVIGGSLGMLQGCDIAVAFLSGATGRPTRRSSRVGVRLLSRVRGNDILIQLKEVFGIVSRLDRG
jgi:hypothetical protein